MEVFAKSGSKKGSVTLNPDIFGVRVNNRLLDLARNAYAANKRQGTAHTKERADVRGGGAKPWKQKGTGRARFGSSRNPIWRGGGTVFGPRKRDYSVDMPKKMRLEALRSALSLRCKDAGITVIEDFSISAPKTKEFASILKALKLEKGKTLCVVDDATENLKRAVQNIANAKLVSSRDFTAYDVLRKRNLIMAKDALPLLDYRFGLGEVENPKKAPKKETKSTEAK